MKFSGQIFEKYSNIKIQENPARGGRVVPCGRTCVWTDMIKLIAALQNFANSPKAQKSVLKAHKNQKVMF